MKRKAGPEHIHAAAIREGQQSALNVVGLHFDRYASARSKYLVNIAAEFLPPVSMVLGVWTTVVFIRETWNEAKVATLRSLVWRFGHSGSTLRLVN